MIHFVILWTDAFLYLLVIATLIAIFCIWRHPYLRAPWKQVFQRTQIKIVFIFLVCYVAIGLLDSIHFYYKNSMQVYSVLDVIAGPIMHEEKTYSAPFASSLYNEPEIKLKYRHILGTDKIGNDVLYEDLKSVRTALVIGTLATLFMLPFALIFGTMAGFFGGLIDDVIQYIYTVLSSIPGVLLISASVLALQVFIENHNHWFPSLLQRADARLLALCLILGITSWTSLCRLLRAETLKIRELQYVTAAKALGVKHFKIILRHILPNVMHIVIITIILDFSALVLAEAVLTYVGVGVDPTTISWGNMINTARLELAREPIVWWPLLSAFIFMFALVLSANIFADSVRDAFDPKLKISFES